jgi:DNA-binding beta-propeller fold protein YncE
MRSRIIGVASGTALLACAAGTGASAQAQTAAPGATSAPTAYVVNYAEGPGTVTPVNTATNTAGKSINVGESPQSIALAP